MDLSLFQQMVEKERLPHAFLFSGAPEEVQKGISALLDPLFQKAGEAQFLKWKKGNHPDVHTLHPEGKGGLHSMQALRTLQEQCALVPLEGPKKCFILYDAERMLPTSSNALLKTFEEPQAKTLLILTTAYPERLLPTVRSRCQWYRFSDKQEREEPLFDLLIPLLRGQRVHEITQQIDKELEEERTKRVKDQLSALSKEITASQKESLLKEIEGAAALHFQQRSFALLEGCLKIYRDLYVHHLGLPPSLLFYPDLLSEIILITPKPLEKVEPCIQEAKTAVQRGFKLSTVFQHLPFTLEI